MFKKIALCSAAAVAAMTAFPAAAEAQSRYGYYDRYGYDQRYDQRRYDPRYDRGRYQHRYQQQCSGTTGTIIGAIAGGLLGREVAGRGDRTTGAVIGGAAGALAGRAIDKNVCQDNRRR